MSHISTHVLDTSAGRPGIGIIVVLESLAGQGWQRTQTGQTDSDGRCPLGEAAAGTYRLTFGVGKYYRELGQQTLYPEVSIVFTVAAAEAKYHIPLLLNPFGYTTYRGT